MKIKTGDIVVFSRAFLRSTGQFTGWSPFAKGRVVALETLSHGFVLASIQWDCGHASRVNVGNLILANRRHLESV